MAVRNENEPGHDSTASSLPPTPPELPAPAADDVAIGQAKREAAAARIREIRWKGQERIDQMFADHLADHGEETETSAEDFLRETEEAGRSRD